ncbi:primary-amine oxidase [Streptomyces sp. NPDC057474]|uniref:primary-amine oxidase n=1 Tax=Streptomyces sp. NPDC057474 TaxID=3346144 RepID=UPI0036C8B1FF
MNRISTEEEVEVPTGPGRGAAPVPEPALVAEPATHPLDPLTADELVAARAVLAGDGRIAEATRFPLVQLVEPAKEEVLAFTPGDRIDRRVGFTLLDTSTGAAAEAIVSLLDQRVVSYTDLSASGAQPPLYLGEYDLVADIVKADERWRDAMRGRGVSEQLIDGALIAPLSAGSYDLPGEAGRRLSRALAFLRHGPQDSPWAHPVDGLAAYVDLISREVVEIVDTGTVPIPETHGNFDEEHVGPPRTSLRPLEITQPEGPSFTVDGQVVSWEGWRFRVSFDPREGLVLHQVELRDADEYRPVMYRASIAEMVVPYSDPSPTRFWQNYFDVGEYSFGRLVNSLELGCDCLGEIHYFDAVMADDDGLPITVTNAVCMHEEDYGVLWKHRDDAVGLAETRRSRRLVISFFVTVGNYDYGFYWYLYLDGTIALEGKATGIVFTSAMREDNVAHATEIAPGLGAPFHQHLFCARLDMTVDGTDNTVEEVEFARVPKGPGNPYGNAFTVATTPIERESTSGRLADANRARAWRITSASRRNAVGRPTAFKLIPTPSPTLLADDDASISKRAAFATKHLWVTRYDPAERYPAGDHPNQHAGGAGIPAFVAQDRELVGTDVVLWHTFGVSHAPRLEDWPVMPVDYVGFTLKPEGFFDRNPALDLPRSTSAHCRDSRTRGHGCH